MGKLNLVDLAGSERQSKTGATGPQEEATCSNSSSSSIVCGCCCSSSSDGAPVSLLLPLPILVCRHPAPLVCQHRKMDKNPVVSLFSDLGTACASHSEELTCALLCACLPAHMYAGDRLKEATKINLSLSALGNVISALVDGKSGEPCSQPGSHTHTHRVSRVAGGTNTQHNTHRTTAADDQRESQAFSGFASKLIGSTQQGPTWCRACTGGGHVSVVVC